MSNIDEKYMRRALQLAFKGYPFAFPNPMVGCVIVAPDGRIIGEGYHHKCGEAHAEVNAINAVADQEALKTATMYVTLEPCAHTGRTGPCAQLIIEKGIPEVVVATRDPFEKVDGKGIEMLRDAGVKVHVGLLEDDARRLNCVFFTAHTLHRPFVLLKWAQSSDGFLDSAHSPQDPPQRFSTPLTSMMMHRLRAACDGILVGSGTVIADDPSLDTRLWPGYSPRPVILDRRHRIKPDSKIMQRDPLIVSDDKPLADILHDIYDQGITCLMVEGGAKVLSSFVNENLWDMARVEVAPIYLEDHGRKKAPTIKGEPFMVVTTDGQLIKLYAANKLIDVKNL